VVEGAGGGENGLDGLEMGIIDAAERWEGPGKDKEEYRLRCSSRQVVVRQGLILYDAGWHVRLSSKQGCGRNERHQEKPH
jgi:hypothetical protein